jgi:hypothetical protein
MKSFLVAPWKLVRCEGSVSRYEPNLSSRFSLTNDPKKGKKKGPSIPTNDILKEAEK